jgi:hypothetical protein
MTDHQMLGIAMAENSLVVRLDGSPANKLGDLMNSIRSWLDSQKIQPAVFRVVPSGLEMVFRHEHEAALFREQFGSQLA